MFGKTRLRLARLVPGAIAFEESKPLNDEPVTFAHGNVASIGWVDAKTSTVTVADVTCASNKDP